MKFFRRKPKPSTPIARDSIGMPLDPKKAYPRVYGSPAGEITSSRTLWGNTQIVDGISYVVYRKRPAVVMIAGNDVVYLRSWQII